MSERESILLRIREALKRPAPRPGDHVHLSEAQTYDHRATASQARQWLPPVGDLPEQWMRLFQGNATDLKSEFHLVEGTSAIAETVKKLCELENWKRAASHSGLLASAACQALDIPVLAADQLYNVSDLEACDVGITECDALIAQTGSILVTNRTAGGRALSVLPPHHVVLARRDQLLPDLPAAFEFVQRKYAGNYPSFISLITGPSRTGDIERILVLGAHGPKRLTIVCG